MSIAPPNYRRLNPMTAILADLSELETYEGEHTVNLVDGSPTFGTITLATAEVLSLDFTSEDGWFLGANVLYEGDADAFVLTGIGDLVLSHALVDNLAFFVAIPGSASETTLDLEITATAADDAVAKTGTLTFFDTASRAVKVLTLSKTYDAP